MRKKVIKQIELSGFEPKHDPLVRVLNDGSLSVVFRFMPPLWDHRVPEGELGPYAYFDYDMSKAIGADVAWVDREVFVIEQPESDTVDRLRQFLESYKATRARTKVD